LARQRDDPVRGEPTQEALMRRALRFLAVSVPILISLTINIVLAAPGKMAANIKTTTSQIHDLAPTQADIVRLFIR
jgi:hypothetical protein